MSYGNIVVVNQAILDMVDSALPSIMDGKGIQAVLLLDRSGMILTSRGEPPLHPDQMGAVSAGLFSAMRTFIKATRADEFLVQIPANRTVLQFNQVDATLLLVSFYSMDAPQAQTVASLRSLADRAREILATDQTQDRRLETGDFILDKLNEILQ